MEKGYRVTVTVEIDVQKENGEWYPDFLDRHKLFVVASSEDEARTKAEQWVERVYGDWAEPYTYTETFKDPDGTIRKEVYEATLNAAIVVKKEPYDMEWFYRSRLPGLILVE